MQTKKELRHALVGPAIFWKMKREFQIHFLKLMNLLPEHYFLDLGCGTLRGGVPIVEYLQEGHYFGIESRKEVLDEGRKELEENGLKGKRPKLLHTTDISQLMLDRRFDYIWAYSVLIHMTDNILDNTLSFVGKHLLNDGTFYANVNIGTRDNGSWQGFPVVWKTLEFYHYECSKYDLVLADIGPLKDFGHVSNVAAQDNQRMLKITKG